jgi:hypothetical protein
VVALAGGVALWGGWLVWEGRHLVGAIEGSHRPDEVWGVCV